jgi:hypothetical protein
MFALDVKPFTTYNATLMKIFKKTHLLDTFILVSAFFMSIFYWPYDMMFMLLIYMGLTFWLTFIAYFSIQDVRLLNDETNTTTG